MDVTDRVAGIERTSIRTMFDMAEDAEGDLVRLELGEPDFATPAHVTEAAFEAARGGATGYTSNAGLPELRAAIAGYMESAFGVPTDPGRVVVTVGGMEALHLATLAIAGPGEEVLVPTPAFPNYLAQARLADARPVEVPLPAEDGFGLDPGRIEAAMGEDTAAVVLNAPSNPTGRVFEEDAVREVVAAAADHDAWVIADEAYRPLTYEGSRRGVAAVAEDPSNVLTVGTCSKAYAMTGWRLGWLTGPAEVIEGVTRSREATTACASSVAQHAAIEALTGCQEPVAEMRAAFRERRDLVLDRVAELPAVSCPRPEGAFYVFLDVRELEGSSLEVAERLLREYGVVVAPGGGFGDAGEGRLRLSYANSAERIEEGLDRVEAMVREELDRNA